MTANITNIPAPRVAFIDERTGLMTREWYRFFLNLFNLTGSGSSDITIVDLLITPGLPPGEQAVVLQEAELLQQAPADAYAIFFTAIQELLIAPAAPLGTIATQNADQVELTGGVAALQSIRALVAGGYLSSDNSPGVSATITTATLVGKTITVKDGLITDFS